MTTGPLSARKLKAMFSANLKRHDDEFAKAEKEHTDRYERHARERREMHRRHQEARRALHTGYLEGIDGAKALYDNKRSPK